jgi:hypothetical protein
MNRRDIGRRLASAQKAVDRNQLYALSVLPPAIFLVTGHVVLGLLFVLCVAGGRFSRPRPQKPRRTSRRPTTHTRNQRVPNVRHRD